MDSSYTAHRCSLPVPVPLTAEEQADLKRVVARRSVDSEELLRRVGGTGEDDALALYIATVLPVGRAGAGAVSGSESAPCQCPCQCQWPTAVQYYSSTASDSDNLRLILPPLPVALAVSA